MPPDRPSSEPAVQLAEKLRFLERPESYPQAPAPAAAAATLPVECRETHLSYVFLTPLAAYKLKKPVAHAYADLRTLAGRAANCSMEVELNRRLAPEVYLGLVALVRRADGRLQLGGDGTVLDWLVHMRRLPESRMLDHMITSGTLARADVAVLAERLAEFFAAQPPLDLGSDAYIGHLRDELRASIELLAAPRFGLPADRLAAIGACLQRYLADGADLAARVRAHRIVEGHGDLRPEHVCLLEPPVVIDCLEFSRTLRRLDPFDEIAYLGLECARLGAPWVGPALLAPIATRLRDRPPPRLLAFYEALRACVRARLAAAHLLEPAPRTPEKWLPRARDYLARAAQACALI